MHLSTNGTAHGTAAFIRPYFLVLLASLPFLCLFNVFKQFADGITDTSLSMWVIIGGNLLNIFGNWVLIYGKLGAPGTLASSVRD